MSDAEWDAEDFVPKEINAPVKPAASDRWAGEDEDEVKDSWEDEDEDKKKSDSDSAGAETKLFKKKKKKLADRIAEKQAEKARREEEELLEAKKPILSPEEEMAEKLKRQKMQEEADLQLAKEAFGVTADLPQSGIDAMFPDTEEDFLKFKDAVKTKIQQFQKSKHYLQLLDTLFTDLLTDLEAEEIRKIGSTINSMALEKQRQQKELEKKKKKKSKVAIRSERDNDFGDIVASRSAGYDDFYDDDFI